MTLLSRASLRYLLRHRAQCALAISGIALGVAIVVGMQVAQLSARQSFADALAGVFGRTTHQISTADGLFDESVLAIVRRLAAAARPTPIVDGSVRVLVKGQAQTIRLVGIDALTAYDGTTDRAPAADFDARRFLLQPGAVLVSENLSRLWALTPGDSLTAESTTGSHQLSVLGVLSGTTTATAEVIVADLATAQELLDAGGLLSRIDLDCASVPTCGAQIATLRHALPGGFRVEAAGARLRSAAALTQAFYTNLDALSLLAVLVGGFMIYNTMSFLVLQRQGFFARLRALGVTRAGIARLVVIEAGLLGLLGGCGGLSLGYALATRLTAPVTQTMRDHYFDAGSAQVILSPALAVGALVLALGVSLLAALVPALSAARAEPADAARHSWQQGQAARSLTLAGWLGVAAAFAGLALLALSSRSLIAGFAALGLLVTAAMLIAPWLVQTLLAGAVRHVKFNLTARIALRGASRAMGRVGMAVAALMAATATSIGVGLMVASFRVSVTDWLDHLLRADLYVTQATDASGRPTLEPALIDAIRALPDIAALSLIRRTQLSDGNGDVVQVNAYELPLRARRGFEFIDGTAPRSVWQAWAREDIAIVSQPYAYRHHLRRGDTLTLRAPDGPFTFRVAGVYRDYGNEQGVVAINLARYRQHWRDQRVHGAGVYPRAGADTTKLRIALSAMLPPASGLAVWSNAALKNRSLAIFDRTFAVTDVLTLFSTLVAALGVFNALLALHLERTREYAVMLAVGSGAGLLRRILYTQTLAIGVLAATLAIPLGWLVAVLLIDVINIRSFGWSMSLALSPRALLIPALCAILAALAAAIYPVERAVRIEPAAALRYE